MLLHARAASLLYISHTQFHTRIYKTNLTHVWVGKTTRIGMKDTQRMTWRISATGDSIPTRERSRGGDMNSIMAFIFTLANGFLQVKGGVLKTNGKWNSNVCISRTHLLLKLAKIGVPETTGNVRSRGSIIHGESFPQIVLITDNPNKKR